MRLCLTTPGDDDPLTGAVAVTGTVEDAAGAPPAVKYVQFYFTASDRDESAAVLRDYAAPFTFTLPTDRWADGDYRLEMEVMLADRFTSDRAGITVTTANDVGRVPVSTGRWAPHSVESEQPVVIAAVGDGAGGLPAASDVADLVAGWDPQLFLYLGDVYNVGSYTEFLNYYEPTFGRLKAITDPVPGDHEGGRQFQGYLDYWDSSEQYYTATAGSWRLFALNDTARFDQTAPGTGQFEWLHRQIEANENAACTIVYMHEPRWGQSPDGDKDDLDALWRLLVAEGVDILITGHEHNYQRWEPLDADGHPSPTGMTEFVVGTGGHELITYTRTDSRLVANQQDVYGALRLELGTGEAHYAYVDTNGDVLDDGTITCSGRHNEATEGEAPLPASMGAIVNTNGLGALCLVGADYGAAAITVLPDGTRVELRGAPVGDWQPVRCAGQDGFVVVTYIDPDD
ncbi:MAG TPA: metallophosphoesterase [Thermomicrobiales bacterium]|nr:metallophosphoesterase [Thermomicrobiales bacterium]